MLKGEILVASSKDTKIVSPMDIIVSLAPPGVVDTATMLGAVHWPLKAWSRHCHEPVHTPGN